MNKGDLLVTLIINQVRLDRDLCLAFRLVNWKCMLLINAHQHVDQGKTCGHRDNSTQCMMSGDVPDDIAGLWIKKCYGCYDGKSSKYLVFDRSELFWDGDDADYDFAIAYADYFNIPYVQMTYHNNKFLIFLKKHMKKFIQISEPQRKKRKIKK